MSLSLGWGLRGRHAHCDRHPSLSGISFSSSDERSGEAKKIASKGKLRFGGACIELLQDQAGTSSRHWRSVVRGYWRSLYKRSQPRLPLSTAASCRPAQRRPSCCSRTMLTIEVSRKFLLGSVTAVTGLCGFFGAFIFYPTNIPRARCGQIDISWQ